LICLCTCLCLFMAALVPLHLLLALITACHVTLPLLKRDVAFAATFLFT